MQFRVFLVVGLALAWFAVALGGCNRTPSNAGASGPSATVETAAAPKNNRSYEKPPQAEIRQRLNDVQYEVTQNSGTEPPFKNEYWDNKHAGLYVDVVTGEPLFSSTDKFESGTGWPSFTQPVEKSRIVQHTDVSLGMARTEVRSKSGDSHLGHVFDDGPEPTGLRYCINSASLRFIPAEKLESEGYSEFLSLFPNVAKKVAKAGSALDDKARADGYEVAYLAGGCFWGMEELLGDVPGVIETDVGYMGGAVRSPTYEDVKTGRSGHAESVRVVFDPEKLTYRLLLTKWFFRMHDPTTKDQQGNDIGSQYRSAIFTTSNAQREAAQAAIAEATRSGQWQDPIVTQVVGAGPFTQAEDYHQDYLEKNPGGYTCHYLRDEVSL